MDVKALIHAAEEVINSQTDNHNHTVGAAVLDQDGTISIGVNLYHFTGGPCGELTALANAIAQGKIKPKAIVAVGNNGRGVLAPCGRCRQVLFDYYPEIEVVLAGTNEPITKPIKALLPDTFDWNSQQT